MTVERNVTKKGAESVFTIEPDESPQADPSVLEIAEALFDRDYYTDLHPEVEDMSVEPFEHYLRVGWKQGFDPTPKFSTSGYLAENQDVEDAGFNPLIHFVKYGRREGRKAVPVGRAVLVTQSDDARNRAHLAEHFDAVFYAKKYPDVALATNDLLGHYLETGWTELRDPASWFSTEYYLRTYPDVKASGMNPLLHFISYGRHEGRKGVTSLAEHFDLTFDPRSKYPVLSLPARPASEPTDGQTGYPRLAVHLHCHYADLLDSMYRWLERIPCKFELFVSITDAGLQPRLEADAIKRGLSIRRIAVSPNRGRDLAPMLVEFGAELSEYDVCLHIHTKKSVEKLELGRSWLSSIEDNLMFNGPYCDNVLKLFRENPKCGIVAPYPHKGIQDFMVWGRNTEIASDLLDRLNLPTTILGQAHIDFPAGSMFWFRPKALAPIFDAGLQYSDFPREPIDDDGTLAHAIERCFFHIADHGGYEVFKARPQGYHQSWPAQVPPRLSVVIPARNGLPWIWHAVASILNQNAGSVPTEIIIVNNNSTDGTLERLRGLEKIYPRIRIVNETAPGAGAARNRGLDLARGDYIMFLDADDVLLPSAVENLFEAVDLNRPAPDFVTSSLVIFDEDAQTNPMPFPRTNRVEFLDRGLDQKSRVLWERMLADFGPCAKVYSRDFLDRHKIRFPTDVNFEDNSFIYDVYFKAEMIGVVFHPTYLYRKYKANVGQTQSTELTAETLKAQFDALDMIITRHGLGSRRNLLDKLAVQALARKLRDEVVRTGLPKEARRLSSDYPNVVNALAAYGEAIPVPGLKRLSIKARTEK